MLDEYQNIISEQEIEYDSLVEIYKSGGLDNRLDLLMRLLDICPVEDNMNYVPEASELVTEALSQANDAADVYDLTDKLADLKLFEAAYYGFGGDDSLAIELFLEELELRKSIKDTIQSINNYMRLANTYDEVGDLFSKLAILKDAIATYEKWSYLPGQAKFQYQTCLFYSDLGEVETALSYIKKSQEIEKEIGDTTRVTRGLYLMGLFYAKNGFVDSALVYFESCIQRASLHNDTDNIIQSKFRIGRIYFREGKYLEAKEVQNEVKSLAIKNEYYEYYFRSSLEIAGSCLELGEKQEAEQILLGLLNLVEQLKMQAPVSVVKKELAKLYYQYGDYAKAKLYITPALEWVINNEGSQDKKEALHIAYKVDSASGNYREALSNYQLLSEINKLLDGKDLIMNEAKLNYKNEMQIVEQQNEADQKIKDAEIEKQKAEIKSKEQFQYLLFGGLGLVVLFSGFIFNRFRVTQKQNRIIEAQKQEVEKAHTELENTHHELEESHKEITDSINYAERIQRSFLATKEILDENLKDYFVFFKPKEAVSGDFYWAAELNDGNFAWSCADSTGHGVPGAIMSLLNISSLEKSIETETSPEKILAKTREIIINRLKKDGSEEGGKDGMDCNLLVINKERSQLTFASAHNPVIIVRGEELIEYKGDKIPVGKHDRDNEPFTLKTVQLQKGDVIYALTDGFPDQFGGPKGKKYMIKNLKKKFVEIGSLPMGEQYSILEDEFKNWKADNEQIDDVCVIGVRI